jgi:hypothetical protein
VKVQVLLDPDEPLLLHENPQHPLKLDRRDSHPVGNFLRAGRSERMTLE